MHIFKFYALHAKKFAHTFISYIFIHCFFTSALILVYSINLYFFFRYQYWPSQIDRGGKELSLGDPVLVSIPFAYARDFNVEVTSATSFHISWKLPEDTSVTAVRVVRSDTHYPADVDDGVTIYEGLGTDVDDANLVSAKGYSTHFTHASAHVHSTRNNSSFFICTVR